MDDRGVPGLLVATEEFREAAAYQAKSLGFEPAIVWVPHPIQNRTADELEFVAGVAFEEIFAALTSDAEAQSS